MGIITNARAFLILGKMIDDAKKETKMGNEITPGYKTSEFWLHIVAQLPMVLGLFLGASNPVVIAVAAAGALASAVYTVSRSGLKKEAIASVAAAAATAAADSLAKSAPVK